MSMRNEQATIEENKAFRQGKRFGKLAGQHPDESSFEANPYDNLKQSQLFKAWERGFDEGFWL